MAFLVMSVPPATAADNSTSEQTGSVTVTTVPSGATVSIDGISKGTSPVTESALSSGVLHTISASMDGYNSASRTITLGNGEDTAVALTLEAIPTPTPTATATPTPTPTATPTATATPTPTPTATPTPTPTATPTATATPTPTPTATPTATATPTPTPTATPTATATPTPTPTATPTATATPTPTATATVPPTPAPTSTPVPGVGWYKVSCNVESAEVIFDNTYMGRIQGGSLSVPVTVGTDNYKQFTVSKSGYNTYKNSLPASPKAGETVSVYATLQPSGPTDGQLTVSTSPSGASVYIDKTYKGTTPITFSLSPGTHSLKITMSGYEDHSESVIITAGQTISRSVTLHKPDNYGTLVVTSEPDNAYVYLDGSGVGRTAVTLKNIAVGNHQIRLTANGFTEWTTTKYVYANGVTTVHATLQRTENPNIAHIKVISHPGEAEVYLDGSFSGYTNDAGVPGALTLATTPGNHKISIEKIGYRDYDVTQYFNGGTTSTIEKVLTKIHEPVTGSVDVTSTPSGANVYLDDNYKGITPVTLNDVPAGNHKITLMLDGYSKSEGTTEVEQGKTSSVSVSLSPVQGGQSGGGQQASPGFGIVTVLAGLSVAGLILRKNA